MTVKEFLFSRSALALILLSDFTCTQNKGDSCADEYFNFPCSRPSTIPDLSDGQRFNENTGRYYDEDLGNLGIGYSDNPAIAYGLGRIETDEDPPF